jgi:gluconokinase
MGDGGMANVGSGCAAPGRIALTVGTTSAARAVVRVDDVVPPKGLWLYLLDARRGVLGGALSEGGNLFAWMERALCVPNLSQAEEEVAKLPPDGHGLTILPFLAGERSLGWHAEARASVTGIHLDTTAYEILRAGTEALAYRIGTVYDQLVQALRFDAAAPTVVASGGALLNSSLFQQIVADTLGVPLHRSREHEASARGAALMALESLGILPDVAQVPPDLEGPVWPDPARGAIYKRAAQRQQRLYHLLLEVAAHLQ